jgi:hypothetical protein
MVESEELETIARRHIDSNQFMTIGSWCNMDVCGARHKMRRYRERKSGVR